VTHSSTKLPGYLTAVKSNGGESNDDGEKLAVESLPVSGSL
jgi:hypothetical protein